MVDEVPEVKEVKKGMGGVIFKIVLVVLLLALGVFAGILVAQQKPQWFGLTKGTVAAQAEVDSLVARVGKLIALPTDEKPTVATVTDASKVKDQSFFQKAMNGDRVLIYQKAQEAILYRPSANIIVEVGAVNINNQAAAQPSPSPSKSPSPTPKSGK